MRLAFYHVPDRDHSTTTECTSLRDCLQWRGNPIRAGAGWAENVDRSGGGPGTTVATIPVASLGLHSGDNSDVAARLGGLGQRRQEHRRACHSTHRQNRPRQRLPAPGDCRLCRDAHRCRGRTPCAGNAGKRRQARPDGAGRPRRPHRQRFRDQPGDHRHPAAIERYRCRRPVQPPQPVAAEPADGGDGPRRHTA